jgi:hypothetical protein
MFRHFDAEAQVHRRHCKLAVGSAKDAARVVEHMVVSAALMGLALGSAIQLTSFWMNAVVLSRLSWAGNNDAAQIAFGLTWCLAACAITFIVASIARRVIMASISSSSKNKHMELPRSFCTVDDDDQEQELHLHRAMAQLERRFIAGVVAGIIIASTI